MGDAPRRASYSGSGDIAILCEGDLAGYEASFLKRWSAETLRANPLVDTWPCGTGQALLGFADAVGRSVPVVVIEDRDFRTETEAQEECKERRKDRERRGVTVGGWMSWCRNEIENYLLEPSVLCPAMSNVFGCSEGDVRAVLADAVTAQRTIQAARLVIYRARRTWTHSDPAEALSRDIRLRVQLSDDGRSLVPPDRAAVRSKLERNAADWRSSVGSRCDAAAASVLTDFDEKAEEWAGVDTSSKTWLLDWAGKEILQAVRVLLAARFGLPDKATRQRQPWEWPTKRGEFDRLDRELEHEVLQAPLIDKLLMHVASNPSHEISVEMGGIADVLRHARPGGEAAFA
ncbi:MAG: hypothetical protein AB1486_29655 [Planctomycetota bacterium]